MIRITIIIIFLTTISVSGQDSTLVREFCNSLRPTSDIADLESQVTESFHVIRRYLERNPFAGDNPIQEGLRFQYRLGRELKKNCPNYTSEQLRMTPMPVIDLENRLTTRQIDSLSILMEQVNTEKDVYLYIVTIDDFYPDSTITDFSNRYREFWVPQTEPKKGVVLIVFSATQRQVRVSTGDASMSYLTDKECDDVIRVMTPYFKTEKYLEGLTNGVIAIKSKL
jgi:hypothetical protein